MKYLNLGCGTQYLPGWVNIDFVARPPHVIGCDLSKGIPLENESCTVVYHSHILEHFGKHDGNSFLKECYRVLKPGGIVRVVVPDFYILALNYVKAFQEACIESSEINVANYEWALIEMIDQMTRQESGGEMGKYWQRTSIINEEIIEKRLGQEYINWRRIYLLKNASGKAIKASIQPNKSFFKQLSIKWKEYWLKRWGLFDRINPKLLFDQSGEKHRWMYDQFGLEQTLLEIGFINVHTTNAFTSKIAGWEQFMQLDVTDGLVRKPDSLFMEAVKPS